MRTDLAEQAARIALGMQRAAVPREDAAPDDLIAGSGFWPEWAPGDYSANAVCRHGGQVWRCVQAHDSAGQSGWEPGVEAALWAAYHATEPALARPWFKPFGAHDAYLAGEVMIWSDGLVYRCKEDGMVWGPDEVPGRWVVVGEEDDTETGPGPVEEPGEDEPTPEPEVEPGPTYEAWKAWGGHNSSLYQVGDRVTHGGKTWECTSPNNSYEPGVWGWKEVTA